MGSQLLKLSGKFYFLYDENMHNIKLYTDKQVYTGRHTDRQ